MKRLLLSILLLQVAFTGFGQNPDIGYGFARYPWKGNNDLLYRTIAKYHLQDGQIHYRIPLTFWIYVDKRGFGPGPVLIKKQINQLNKYFNQYNHTGISFYLADIKVVQRKDNNVGYLWENLSLTMKNRVKGTVNIHIVNNLRLNLLTYKYQLGGTYNSLTKALIISKANFPSGLAHEMGHYFGLLHPHRHWKGGKLLAESVSRTRTVASGKKNCEVRGDYLCDTPAEPDLSEFTDDKCHYTGNLTDPWGEPYKPETDNIMSYFENKHCRRHFTPMQIAAMLYNIEHSKYSYGWAVNSQNRIYSPDAYEPDNYPSIATPLEPDSTQYHTFNYIFSVPSDGFDATDYYKISVESPRERLYLHINAGDNAFPAMKITLLDNFKVEIRSFYVTDPTVIRLPSLEPNVYYLKFEVSPVPDRQFVYDYRVKLEKLQ